MSDSDNELTSELEAVGKFSLPSLDSFKNLPADLRDAAKRNLTSGSLAVDNYLNSRRELVQEFINELTSGFSLQSAFDNIQPLAEGLTSVVEAAVHLPIDEEEEKNEPSGVKPVVQTDTPIITEALVKPKDGLERYDYLTELKPGDFSNQQVMRQKIKNIVGLPDLSGTEKSVLIQRLMTKSYYEKKKSEKQEPTREAVVEEEEEEELPDDDEVRLMPQDQEATYYDPESRVLGCQHYQRNCKIECPICRKWFTCRFCHDAVVKDHQLPRAQIKHVLCMLCATPQTPAQYCINCSESMAQYYCDKCKLFDNDPNKDIYHCDDCGICRLGLGLNQDFFHCRNCDACISIELRDGGHRCVQNSTHSNCAICEEYMFNSTRTVCVMSCGHAIHQSCYDEYTRHSYKCPICSRTITNMEIQFRVLDMEIEEQPLPAPFGNWKCVIKCNDCGAMSVCKYHVLGLKCDNCKSYNTMQFKVIKPELGEDEDEILRTLDVGDRVGEIPNILNTNFRYDQPDLGEAVPVSTGEMDLEFKNGDDMIEDSYVDNFMSVVENLERYSSIGDAFKDWLNANKGTFSISLMNQNTK